MIISKKSFCFTFIFFPCALSFAAGDIDDEAKAIAAILQEKNPESVKNEISDRPLRGKKEAFPARFTAIKASAPGGEKLPEIPGIDHPITRQWIRHYSARGRLEWLADTLKAGAPYMDFIRTELAARGMPAEILYLPVIESAYNIGARSRSGAAGLWQFMRNSMSPYMRYDEWRDERFDFWKSTNGALSKLQAHYRELKSWPMALAAYNSGGGAINRVIKSSGINDYWTLAEKKLLKTESIHYVPKLLAIYYIASNPRKFNLKICTPAPYYEWATINVPKQVNISALAVESGIPLAVLRDANRELTSLITPPGAYSLKVPLALVPVVSAALENPELNLLKTYFYTIRPGDTLFALSLHYGVKVEQILEANPGLKSGSLLPGSRVAIPALKDAAPYNGELNSKAAEKVPELPAAPWTNTYTVKKGETLWSISRIYKVTPELLARVNEFLPGAILSIGTVLRVP